jgi:hypothetical protein
MTFYEVLAELPDRVRERFNAGADQLRQQIGQRIGNVEGSAEGPDGDPAPGEESAEPVGATSTSAPDPPAAVSSSFPVGLRVRLAMAFLIALLLTVLLLRGRW